MLIQEVEVRVFNLKTRQNIYGKGRRFVAPFPDDIAEEIKLDEERIRNGKGRLAIVSETSKRETKASPKMLETEKKLSDFEAEDDERIRLIEYAREKYGEMIDGRWGIKKVRARIEELREQAELKEV